MSKILTAGSIAYDHLMNFDGEFRHSILEGKDLKKMSVSFLAKNKDLNFGGCAPNIAYGLSLLGDEAAVVGVGGNDFFEYEKILRKKNIITDFVDIDNESVTAVAYILTDKNQGQIAIFYPGAMSNENVGFGVEKFDFEGYEYGIISPELPARMHFWSKLFKDFSIPYIFDPGQAIPALTNDQFLEITKYSAGLIFNEYEADLIESKLGLSVEKLAKDKEFVIKTLGADGCEVYTKNGANSFSVPAISGLTEVDSTGCGDAFRSGFIHGITNGFGLKRACEMGNTAASFVVVEKGTQSHFYDEGTFMERLVENYGE
ncbi:MAG: carbohydrate kinase family protein [Candidatus Gracilibacteria bacterium]|nr:carbohydrate kinase family protein [Candidatus Gracilibacteria bacterium]